MALHKMQDNIENRLHYLDIYMHDDVIKRKHFPRHWPFVGGNSPVTVNSPHKGQWRGALMSSAPEQTIEQTIETPVARDAIVPIMTSL